MLEILQDYARRLRRSEGKRVEAYQADFGTLFPVLTRKRQPPLPAKLLFGDKSLINDAQNPLVLRKPIEGNHLIPTFSSSLDFILL
ncbi:unnamed protein product [Anisakis simplex]|uniref:Transposase n=1 Tax=Anisakis simplex TaxID=6269 RepID=A0A0M3J0G8_ANISI|nr:unnamed protein product [Anisakis simplex]